MKLAAWFFSFPGLGDSTGARVLAEIGDDRGRFTDARALKAYAGSAPITRASGKSVSTTHRRIKNDRLAAAGWIALDPATHRSFYPVPSGSDGHPALLERAPTP